MFVQIIQGKVKDADLLGRQTERWRKELKPGATGYLGSTSGITPDGRSITLVRFESEQAARANSGRPEQGAWWNETAKAYEGEVIFHDCSEVDLVLGGGSNDAGFVQVIQGRSKDPARHRALTNGLDVRLRESRPDVLGMVAAWHADEAGAFTQAIYFRSEQEARQKEKETEGDEGRREVMSLIEGQPAFLDLAEPDLD